MTADVVESIFKEFKFRTLSKTSSKNQIFKSIMNTAFKANIINSVYNDDLNVSYSINPDLEPYLEPLYNLCINYARGDQKNTFVADDEKIECLE
jgi:hypothetical protein